MHREPAGSMCEGQLVSSDLGVELGEMDELSVQYPPPLPMYPPPPKRPPAAKKAGLKPFRPPPPAHPKPNVVSVKGEHAHYRAGVKAHCGILASRVWGHSGKKRRSSTGDISGRSGSITETRTRASSFASRPRASSFTSSRVSRAYSDITTTTEAEGNGINAAEANSSRFAIACVAVVLLWGSSLSAVTAGLRSSNIIQIPTTTVVVDEAIKLMNESRRLHEQYVVCVEEELDRCNATLTAAQAKELRRTREAQQHNQEAMLSGRATHDSCSTTASLALATMNAWQAQASAGATALPSYWLPTCSADDRARLTQLTGDVSSQKSATYGIATSYSTESQSTVGLLADQLEARAAYDASYLINKTQTSLELHASIQSVALEYSTSIDLRLQSLNMSELLACATLTPTAGACPHGDSARELVQRAQDRLADQYAQAEVAYRNTAERFEGYALTAEEKLAAASSTLTSIANWCDSNLPEMGGFSGLGYSIPDLGVAYTAPATSLPALDLPAGPDGIGESVDAAVVQFQQSVAEMRENANTDTSALRKRIADAVPAGPGDYHPPEVDAFAVKASHQAKSDHFEQEMAESLDEFDQTRDTANQSSFGPIFGSNFTRDAINAARDTSWFNYRDLTDLGVDFDWLTSKLSQIALLLQVLDTILRSLRTVQIFSRFWGRSALPVPPIDMETDADAKARGSPTFNAMQRLALLMTNPILVSTVVVLYFYVIGAIAFSVYRPFYDSYTIGCTATRLNEFGQVEAVGEGTTITRNVYSVAYNYAASAGNKDRLLGIDAYDSARGRYCAQYGSQSLDEQRRVEDDLNRVVSAHSRNREMVMLMRTCYDVDTIDASFDATVTPLTDENGGTYPKLSVTLGSEAQANDCDTQLSNATLQDGVFNCDALPECDMQCNDLSDREGRDNSALIWFTRSACCTFEWYIHAFILRTIFTIIIYLTVNFSRVVFLGGLVRVIWQKLNTGFFSYHATCARNGEHTYEKRDLEDKVESMLGWIGVKGVLFMVAAFAIQLPWIFILQSFVRDLIYADTGTTS